MNKGFEIHWYLYFLNNIIFKKHFPVFFLNILIWQKQTLESVLNDAKTSYIFTKSGNDVLSNDDDKAYHQLTGAVQCT